MTNPLRIRTRVDSETLHLPELRALIGKDVEIIVIEDAAAAPGPAPTPASGTNGEPSRRDGADWRSRFDAMVAEACAAQQHLPAGYAPDDSRDAVYEGRGE